MFVRRKSLCLIAGLIAAAPVCASAQTVDVPRPAPGADITKVRSFDSTHLKDRPYTFDLPKPTFPSTERVQREFVVEYLYDYAISTYTPAVEMPLLPPAAFKRDTPENAVIAMFAAMRAGDFDDFVKCWDEPNQKQLLKDAKENKQDAAFWQKLWGPVFKPVKSITLVDRVETASGYVILGVHMQGSTFGRLPNVFKFVKGEWLATNELANNPIFYQFKPELAGSVNIVPPVDVSHLDKENLLEMKAQERFLRERTTRDRVVQAGP